MRKQRIKLAQLCGPNNDDSPWYTLTAIDSCSGVGFSMAAMKCVKAESAPAVETN